MSSDLTTPAVLDRMARELPDHLALITEERSLTFAQLRDEVRTAAAVMIGLGVQTGERVAIWAPNSWQWVVSCLAIQYAGGVLVPINTAFTAEEAADILARTRATLLIAAGSFFGVNKTAQLDRAALPSLRHVVTDLSGAPAAPLEQVDARAAAVRPDDVADILFTSGTTGRSKGVMCAHRQSLAASAASAIDCRGRAPADRYLCRTPFFHTYGYKDGILGCLQSGATLVTQRTVDPEQAMRLIAEHGVTVMPGPPALFQVLLDHPSRERFDLSSLRMVSTGGAAVSPALLERMRTELGIPVVMTGYGLTESNGFGTCTRPGDDDTTVATTSGSALKGYQVRIGDPDDDGVGEVLLRGPNVMLGYLDDPAATAAVIDADGWLHTGDVGSLDANGYLRITDRLTDMYICGGLNVYPAEVEQVLARLDGVADVAVVGAPDSRLGEVGRAFVVATDGAGLDERAVIAYARGHLAGFKVPRSVEFVDALPRNPGGKVLKTALREIDYTPRKRVGAAPAGLGGPPVGPVEIWVADAWQVLLNIPRPGRRDKFVDLGGDSLAALEFSEMLQTQFGVSMSMDALADRPTIAAVVAGLQPGSGEQRQPVVRLRACDEGPVVLMVPGIGGHAWVFAALADALSTPCGVRALSIMDLRDGDGRITDRIHTAALAAVQDAVGRPIVVAGYSFGALVATELADWLIAHGVAVSALVLLDPDPLDAAGATWDSRTAVTSDAAVVFTPGSAAARKLDEDIAAVSQLLYDAYRDDTVRLPDTTVVWLQSSMMADTHADARTIFGTPVGDVARTVIESDHFGVVQIPGVRRTAQWLDGELVRFTP